MSAHGSLALDAIRCGEAFRLEDRIRKTNPLAWPDIASRCRTTNRASSLVHGPLAQGETLDDRLSELRRIERHVVAIDERVRRIYFAIGDIGAHEGRVTYRLASEAWTSENQEGWTYKEICGPHGRVLYEGPDEAAAQRELDAFLICDAPTTGAYCYSHNTEGR